MTSIRSYISIAIRKVNISILALNLQKLVLVLITSMLMNDNDKKIVKVFYIYYLVKFYKSQK